MTLPLTIADWAATEGRFKKHFKPLDPSQWNEDMVPFHEYLDLSPDDREGKTPYILTLDRDKTSCAPRGVDRDRAARRGAAAVLVAAPRAGGRRAGGAVRDRLVADVEAEYEAKLAAVRAEYEAKLAELPKARGAPDGRGAAARRAVASPSAICSRRSRPRRDERTRLHSDRTQPPVACDGVRRLAAASADDCNGAASPRAARGCTAPISAAPARPSPSQTTTSRSIRTSTPRAARRATSAPTSTASCSRTTRTSRRRSRDPDAGTFQQLVVAAERCPVGIIHPGTPRNPKEKDLAKWLKRAEPFNVSRR